MQTNNKQKNSIIAKRIAPRYVTMKENVFQILSASAYKVYTALRFEADYSNECSHVKRSASFIAEKSGFSRSEVFECFNELENLGLLSRESKQGYQTIYWVADELYYFNKNKLSNESAEIPPVQNLDTPVQNLDTISLIPSLAKKREAAPIFEIDEKPKEYTETYHQNHKEIDEVKKDESIIEEMLNTNTFNIDELSIRTWYENRKQAKKPVNMGIWALMLKQLYKYLENGLNPKEKFENMALNGWMALDIKKELKNMSAKMSAKKGNPNSYGWSIQGFGI
jgi:DNA-binding transcriptional regulator GbsR (MarR family)